MAYYDEITHLSLITEENKQKETIFMNTEGRIIRGIKANQPYYLKSNMEYYKLEKNQYNIYKSIATYHNLPLFSWKRDVRQKQYKAWTEKEIYKQHIIGYDYYIDFDNKDDNDAYTRQEVIEVSEYLTKKGIRHTIYSSGKGYHLKAGLSKENQNPEYCRALTEKLKDVLGLTTPDMSIYRWQGIIKTPYSIDYKTGLLCSPIPLNKLRTFNKEQTRILPITPLRSVSEH